MNERIYLGVLRMALTIPGARSRKDRRQAVVSLRDRVLHRFDVSFHLIGDSDRPSRQVVVLTTSGDDPAVLRQTLDRITAFASQSGSLLLGEVDVEVFRWHPPGLGGLSFDRDDPASEEDDGW